MAHRVVWSLVFVARRPRGHAVAGSGCARCSPTGVAGRLALAAVLIAGNWALYIWGVNNEHVVETSLGYFINPVVTVLIGVVVLHERLRRCSGWLSRSGPRQWSS